MIYLKGIACLLASTLMGRDSQCIKFAESEEWMELLKMAAICISGDRGMGHCWLTWAGTCEQWQHCVLPLRWHCTLLLQNMDLILHRNLLLLSMMTLLPFFNNSPSSLTHAMSSFLNIHRLQRIQNVLEHDLTSFTYKSLTFIHPQSGVRSVGLSILTFTSILSMAALFAITFSMFLVAAFSCLTGTGRPFSIHSAQTAFHLILYACWLLLMWSVRTKVVSGTTSACFWFFPQYSNTFTYLFYDQHSNYLASPVQAFIQHCGCDVGPASYIPTDYVGKLTMWLHRTLVLTLPEQKDRLITFAWITL